MNSLHTALLYAHVNKLQLASMAYILLETFSRDSADKLRVSNKNGIIYIGEVLFFLLALSCLYSEKHCSVDVGGLYRGN